MDPSPARLWNRNFCRYWLGLAATALADAGIYVALPFLVLDSGGDAGTLATILVLGSAPRFLGPLIGSLADRVPLRVPIAAAAILRTVLFGALGTVAFASELPLWVIFVAAPLNGLLTLFVFSAGNVALPHLVPREDLARANGLVQGVTMGLPLVALGVAGVLVATAGPAAVVCIAAPLFLVMGGAALAMRFPPVADEARATPWVTDLRRGAAFVFTRRPLVFLLLSSFVLNASLNALNVVVPILMQRNGRGAAGYGLFESLISVGILAGIVAVGLLGARVRPRTQIGLSQLLFALGFRIMASGGLPFILAGGVVLGIGLGLGEVAILTLVQLAVPDGMRGKVMGVAFTINAVGLATGAWVAGVALDATSSNATFAAAALLGALLCTAWTWLQIADPTSLDRLTRAGMPTTGA